MIKSSKQYNCFLQAVMKTSRHIHMCTNTYGEKRIVSAITSPLVLKELSFCKQKKMEFKHKLPHYWYSLISRANRALCMLLNMSFRLERETTHVKENKQKKKNVIYVNLSVLV